MGIKCVTILYTDSYLNERFVHLKTNHTYQDIYDFLKKLDFNYNSGFGTQDIFGTIWYIDGTWSTRYEYDGSERWQHHVCPTIQDYLQG